MGMLNGWGIYDYGFGPLISHWFNSQHSIHRISMLGSGEKSYYRYLPMLTVGHLRSYKKYQQYKVPRRLISATMIVLPTLRLLGMVAMFLCVLAQETVLPYSPTVIPHSGETCPPQSIRNTIQHYWGNSHPTTKQQRCSHRSTHRSRLWRDGMEASCLH